MKFNLKTILPLLILLNTLQVWPQLKVEHFINKGRTELFNDQFTDAIYTFNVLIRSRPDLSEPHLYRGIAKYNLGDFRGAEFDFTRAIMLDGYDPNAYHYRGVVKMNLYNYYSALDDFEKSIERGPNNPYVYLSRGATKMQMKNYKGAIFDFDTVILLKPDVEVAYLNRAIAKARLEDFVGAIKDCNFAIKSNIFYIEAFTKRGTIKSEMGKYEEALKDFDQAIKLDENDPLVYFFRGTARINAGDTTGALTDFNTVINLDPLNDLTYYNRALIMMQWNEFEKALDDLDQVLKINPENVYTWYNRAYVKMELENYRGALDDYSRAIDIFPDFAAAYMGRANARHKLKDYQGAKNDQDLAFAIINAVNSGEDFGLINSKFSGDSLYLQRIIEFEADFNSNNIAGGKVQNRQVYIRLKPNFSIQYYETDSVIYEQKQTGYRYKPLDDAKYNTSKHAFNISPAKHLIPENIISFIKQKIDSVFYFDPFNAENYFRMGTLDAMLMNFNEAQTAFDRAIDLNPTYLEAYFNRANIRFELIEHQFSIEESTPRITIGNDKTTTSNTSRENALPDFSEVIQDLTRVIELNPDMAFAWYNRGNIKNRMRDFEGALQDYTVAVGLEPDFAEAFYNRALTLIYLKNTKDACLDLSKAGELGVEEAYNVIKRYCNR